MSALTIYARSTSSYFVLVLGVVLIGLVATTVGCPSDSAVTEVRCDTDDDCDGDSYCDDGYCTAIPYASVLTVEIEGLPDELDADVTVQGPDEFEAHLTETATFDELRHGSYELNVGRVEGDPDIFDAVDKTVDLDKNDERSVTISYEVISEFNACGGEELLEFDGEPAEPEESCGDCDDGVLICDGEDALTCMGASEENTCGGCEPLEGEPDQSCGPCGDGVWTCQDDGSLECEDAGESNICGGCEELEGLPGESCELDTGGTGILSCTGADELECVAPGDNACGGDSELDATPGSPCGECNLGVVVCDGTDDVTCQDDEEGVNECGGCSPLAGQPEESCGICDGEWYCATDDHVVCDDATNACGGCSQLDGTPGESCDDDAIWACDGPEAVDCVDEPANACGGEETLEDMPGDVCGPCGDGIKVCASPDSVVCVGASETNECGGCGLLPGEEGEECGTGANWECTDDDTMRCKTDEDLNACGGTDSLDTDPGEVCGPCELDVYECDGDNDTTCSGSTDCPQYLHDTTSVSDIEEESAVFHGELLDLPPITVTEHGFCWDTEPDPGADSDNCESLGEGEESGDFSMDVTDLQPGVEYYVQAYAKTETDEQFADETSFWTIPPKVDNVDATQGTIEEHVTVSWDGVDGAYSYWVYRDGTFVEEVGDDGDTSFSLDDDNADEAGEPDQVENLVVDEHNDRLELSWDEVDVPEGPEHTYTVVAVNEAGDAEPSPEAEGWRGPRELETYEVRYSSSGDTWTSWEEVSDPDSREHEDSDAPKALITEYAPGVNARDAAHTDYVELVAPAGNTEEGDERFYEVRATNETGGGDAADGSGSRTVGDISYHWQYEDAGNFVPVPDCSSTQPDCNDEGAPSDGTPRNYRLVFSADGADDVIEYGGEARRAIQGEVDTVAVEDDDIGSDDVTVTGDISELGIPDPDAHGFCYSATDPSPTHGGSDVTCSDGGQIGSDGEFTDTLTDDIDPATSYWIKAFVHTDAGGAGYDYGEAKSFTTRTEAPTGVETTSHVDYVTIEWDTVEGADEYIVIRDPGEADEEVFDGIEQTSFDDTGADDAPRPQAPEIVSITQGDSGQTDGVKIEWEEADSDPGTNHDYDVIAVNEEGLESDPTGTQGQKAAPDLDRYELCIGGADNCDSNETWEELDEIEPGDNDLEYLDTAAPEWSIVDGVAEASDGEFEEFVRLTAPGWQAGEPDEQLYQIRAVAEDGTTGDPSSEDDGAGWRGVGDLEYLWFGEGDDADQFEALFDDPSTDDEHDDYDAPSDGSEREYYVQIDAPGATAVYEPDVPGGEDATTGYRATAAEVLTLATVAGDISAESAVVWGELQQEGAPNTEALGFCWNDIGEPADEDDGECESVSVVDEGEQFSYQIDGLDAGSEYVVRAWADTENASRAWGGERTFITEPPAPSGVDATEGDHDGYVTIQWDASTGADDYRIYRDGTEIGDSPVADGGQGSFSVNDGGADAAPEPGEPDNFQVTEETTEHIRIEWDAADTDAGVGVNDHEFEVVATNESGDSDAGSDTGWRAERPVTEYEFRSSIDQTSWSGWEEVTNSDERYNEHAAEQGSIDHDETADAGDATHVDYVELTTSDATPQDGEETHYEVRAVNDTGAGDASGGASGNRQVGDVAYDWQRADSEGGPFSSIGVCDSSETDCNDTTADDSGQWHYYQVVLSAEGAEDVTVDAGGGRTAVQGEVETDPLGVADIGAHEVDASATIEELGIPKPDEHGFCYDVGDTTPDHSDNEDCIDLGEITDENKEKFEETITGLSSETEYSVTAFVHTDATGAGYDYGAPQVFTTEPPCDPEVFEGGDGTSDEPFEVGEAQQLNEIGTVRDCLDENFLLVDDIDMEGVDYNIIGATDDEDADHEHFQGYFDGDGFTISNLTVDQPDDDYVGMFGIVHEDGEIRGVGLEDADVTGDQDVGALIGHNAGELKEVWSTGEVSGEGDNVGGLIGYNSSDDLKESWSSAEVSGEGDNVGGLIGYNSGDIMKLWAIGEVSGEGDNVGGLVGFSQGQLMDTWSSGEVSGTDDVGGLVGEHTDQIKASYWDEETSGTSIGVGSGDTSGTEGLETDEFDDEDNFDEWNFTSVWTIDTTPQPDEETRPVFQWQ